jgi:hypothetical protein
MTRRSLDIMGVNIVGAGSDIPVELDVAHRTFNSVRFRSWRFLRSFLDGHDLFTPISNQLPEGIKLVPMLFQGLGGGEMMVQLRNRRKLLDWLDFWLKDEHLEKYRYIDVCNEPRTISHPWQREFIVKMLQEVKGRVGNIPVTTGLAFDTFVKDINLFDDVAPYCDYVAFHFYSPTRKFEENLLKAIRFCRDFGKPIVISEFNRNVENERQQSRWLSKVLNVMRDEWIKGYFVHNLREPNPKLHWGIYYKDWTPKKCVGLFP